MTKIKVSFSQIQIKKTKEKRTAWKKSSMFNVRSLAPALFYLACATNQLGHFWHNAGHTIQKKSAFPRVWEKQSIIEVSFYKGFQIFGLVLPFLSEYS